MHVHKTNFQYWNYSISFFFYSSFSFPNWKDSEKPGFIKKKVWWPPLLKKEAYFSQGNVSVSIFCTNFNLYRTKTDWNYEKLIRFVPWLLGDIVCVGVTEKKSFKSFKIWTKVPVCTILKRSEIQNCMMPLRHPHGDQPPVLGSGHQLAVFAFL